MNWTAILRAGNVPDSPGRAEAINRFMQNEQCDRVKNWTERPAPAGAIAQSQSQPIPLVKAFVINEFHGLRICGKAGTAQRALLVQREARQQVLYNAERPSFSANRRIAKSCRASVTTFDYLSLEMSEAVLLVDEFHN